MTSDLLIPSADKMRATMAEVLEAGGLPEPKGWKILIMVPDYSEKTDKGIYLPQEAVAREEMATPIGLVVSMGDACYKDARKFPAGAYCKPGDFVILRSYSGTRFKVNGKELRLINDDTVEAVVPNPRIIERV